MLYNIDPKIWGKSYWEVLHTITFAYPDSPNQEDKSNVKNFFIALKPMLPCETCRLHYAKNLEVYPLTDDILSSKYKLISWIVNLHNEVNKRTGKPIFTVEDVINKYTNKSNDSSIIHIVTLILLLILIILLIVYMKLK
jgi:hypothetical protein